MKRVLGLLSAVCIALFMLTYRDTWTARASAGEKDAYLAAVAAEAEGQLRHRENLALWYNHALASGECPDGVDGGSLLSYGGVVALVELPGSEWMIPVYWEDAQAGFCHREGSALPMGGQRIPSILEFRGKQSVEVPDVGSCFRIYVLDRVLTYRVVGHGQAEIPQGDVCILLFGDVPVVGLRVYQDDVFGAKN